MPEWFKLYLQSQDGEHREQLKQWLYRTSDKFVAISIWEAIDPTTETATNTKRTNKA